MLFSFTPAAVEVIPDEGQKPDASMRAHAHFPWVPVQPTESAGGPVTGLLAYSQSFILKLCINVCCLSHPILGCRVSAMKEAHKKIAVPVAT